MIEKMKFLSITGPKDDIDRIIDTHLSKYDIQFENAFTEIKGSYELHTYTEKNPYKAELDHAQVLMSSFDHIDIPESSALSGDGAKEIVKKLGKKVDALQQIKEATEKELSELQTKFEQIGHFIGLRYDVNTIFQFKFIKFRFGHITRENFIKLKEFIYDDIDSIFYKCKEVDGEVWGVYFVPESIADKMDAIYASLHFERLFLPEGFDGTPIEAANKLQAQIDERRKKIQGIDDEIEQLLQDKKEDLASAYAQLQKLNLNFNVRKLAACTKKGTREFYILCGWMTQRAAKVLDKELANEPDTFCIVERDHADVVSKPPTKLQNNTLFKPYEMFVEMYGMPAYEEIDPTPLIAISYSILFGFMFGDAGQGLVLLLGGLLLGKFKHSRLASIIGRCGVFSIIFGLLFGSFFGFEDIIKPLWLRPTQAMMTLPMVGNLNTVFIVSIALGMGIILLTMLLNVINRLRFKEPGEALFDTNGIAGMVFYAAAIVTIVLFMSGHTLPGGVVLAIMFIIPLLVIFFKEPLSNIVEKHAEIMPKEKGMFFVQGFFEMFEVLLSYFSNTLSFVRVGAFAVSHAAMMQVVLMLAGAESGHINWIVVVFGNIFVCGMEGLIVGIQVLRLEYYELFSRFYHGTGKAFLPYGKETK